MTDTTLSPADAGQLVAAKDRAFEASKDAVIAASAALTAAEHRAANAKHDDNAADLVDTHEAADAALKRAKVHAMVCAAQLASARDAHALAMHNSLQDRHDAARAARMTAVQKSDAARAMMAEALGEFHQATAQLHAVYGAGRLRAFDGSLLDARRADEAHIELPSAEVEAALWEGVA